MTPLLFDDLQRDEGFAPEAYPDPGSPLGRACTAKGLALRDWRALADQADQAGLDGGPWTIGYGHTGPEVHPGETCSRGQAVLDLHLDVARAVAALDARLAWWRTLDDVRQDALVEMAFNMGLGRPAEGGQPGHGLLSFVQTLRQIETGAYSAAAEGLLASRWAKQVGQRAERIAELIRRGERETSGQRVRG